MIHYLIDLLYRSEKPDWQRSEELRAIAAHAERLADQIGGYFFDDAPTVRDTILLFEDRHAA